MILSIEELISLLRESVNIQSEEDEVIDPSYLKMTDNDLLVFIKLGINRLYPNVKDIDHLPPNCSEFAIILLTKIELYTKLAVMRAEKVDMGADNNNYLKNGDRFNHYMKLVEEARTQYETWLNKDGVGTVETYEMLNSKYSHTKRYYENQPVPQVSVSVSDVTKDSLHLSWSVLKQGHFGRYSVYLSENPILDLGKGDYSNIKSCVSEEAKLIRNTFDFRNTEKDIENLKPNTTYYLLVISQCRNGVWGYEEVSVTTLEDIEETEEIEE